MKKVLVVLGVVCASLVTHASYLYWQVSPADYDGAEWNTAKIAFATGNVSDWKGGSIQDNVGGITADGTYVGFTSALTSVTPTNDGAYVADIGTLTSGSSYSYWVELYNGDTRVGFSEIGHINSYVSDASTPYVYANAGSLTSSLSAVANATVWHASSYGPVPEPTSAILMLFGAAFLGLKRKNRSIV